MASQPVKLQRIEDVTPLGLAPGDDALLREFRELLERHNSQDRLSLSLTHSHFPLRPGEVLVETTDERRRVHTVRPVELAKVSSDCKPGRWTIGPRGTATATQYCTPRPHSVIDLWPILVIYAMLAVSLVWTVRHLLQRYGVA